MRYWIVSFIVFLFYFQNETHIDSTKYFPSACALVFLALYRFGRTDMMRLVRYNKVLLIYIGLVCISLFRSNEPHVSLRSAFLYVIEQLLFLMMLFKTASWFREEGLNKALACFVFYPVVAFLLLNLFLLNSGISLKKSAFETGNTAESVMLSYVGISLERIEFPLITGLNSFAVYLGQGFLLVVSTYITKLNRSVLILIVGFCLLCGILMIDSRASFFYSLVLPLLSFFLFRKKKVSEKWSLLSFLVILGPFIYMLILPAVLSGSTIASRGDNDLVTGNSRFLIWGICILYFLAFNPIDILGYGHFGHFGSGVSAKWSFLFQGWTSDVTHSPHNAMFSIIFDIGYLGLGVYVYLLYQLFRRAILVSKDNKQAAVIFFSFLLFSIFQGISEASGGYYFINFFYIFITIAFFTNYYFSILEEQ
jgi:hypothetical protein